MVRNIPLIRQKGIIKRDKMRKIVLGILAHVDAGKTTLSESILYSSGAIRKMGRVDNKDAYLDTYELERARGITIFSKQAVFHLNDTYYTLLDTPGHVDFSAEMERTLQVLDYAILVISAADGVQGHTKTLWKLLNRYQIPVFIFINKMDQEGADADKTLQELKSKLDDKCTSFQTMDTEEFYESIAVYDENACNAYLEKGCIEDQSICQMIQKRQIFPCFFGSALKMTGVENFVKSLNRLVRMPDYSNEFGARVFKIGRDEQGNRLTYLKVTGGLLKNKQMLSDQEKSWNEKINQIRIYSGIKYENVNESSAGSICAVTGLTMTYPGEGIGFESQSLLPILEPVLTYEIKIPEECDLNTTMQKIRQLEEEIPELRIEYSEADKSIQAKIMGEVQLEILQSIIAQRFGIQVTFGEGKIVYKETIANTVEGVGHFEPLRHYAEVHLRLEPLDMGSGLQFATECSEDLLQKNWQRLILTHLEEKEHLGVLTGSAITDMKITLLSGKAHQKHTEGGDFRQATYRAVRQGLKTAESVLLEPFYEYQLEIPASMIGRAMTDIEKMHARCLSPETFGDYAILKGQGPVSTMQNYQKEVTAYTKGHGHFNCTFCGYQKCYNQGEIIQSIGYDSERDLENPTGSVFCAHGAGFIVPWYQVQEYMHLAMSEAGGYNYDDIVHIKNDVSHDHILDDFIETEEIDQIISKTFYSNKRDESNQHRWASTKKKDVSEYNYNSTVTRKYTGKEQIEKYLLVDGYNVIFAWQELKELAKDNIDGARGKLMDILCNYQALKKCNLIVVFDAYRIEGHTTEFIDYHNIHVVYTKEAETADQYIERFAHENGRKYDVTVATSDGLEQIIIVGQGCHLISSREFEKEVQYENQIFRETYLSNPEKHIGKLSDQLMEEVLEKLSKPE